MPGIITAAVDRFKDAVDEYNERKEDAEAGRRNKYGLKTALWYEEEEKRQRRRERHKRHRHRRDGSRSRGQAAGAITANPAEEAMMSGANDTASADSGYQSGRSRSHGGDHDRRSGRQNRPRRTRGEEESPVEILERTETPYGRELPPDEDDTLRANIFAQTRGSPALHDSPGSLIHGPQDLYGPRSPKNNTRGGGLSSSGNFQPPRHPKMKSYDDGGLMSLVKAIGVNLFEESRLNKGAAKKPTRMPDRPRRDGGSKKSKRKPRSSDPPPYSRPVSPTPSGEHPSDPATEKEHSQGEEMGQEHHEPAPDPVPEGEERPAEVTAKEEDHEPIVDPTVEVENRQAAEMEEERRHEDPTIEAENLQAVESEAEHAQQEASHGEEDENAADHSAEHASESPESPTDHPHKANVAAGRRSSDMSSMPASNVSLPQSQPPKHTSPAGSSPPLPQATDSGSEFEEPGASDHESDHSDTSTRATVPSSNPPPTARSSTSPTTRGRGRQRGQRGGRGRLRGAADCDDEVGDEYYNLRESYDDEYDNPDPNWFDDLHSSNSEYGASQATPAYQSSESVPATGNSVGTASQSYDSGLVGAEREGIPRNAWGKARNCSHPPAFQIRGGQYGWRPQQFQPRRRLVIKNKDGVWVRIRMTEEQYKFYMDNHPPPERKSKHKSRYSSASESDQDTRQKGKRTNKPDSGAAGSKGNDYKQSRQRSGRRSGYASESESEELKHDRHGRRKTHSKEHKKTHKSSHSKTKSNSKAKYVPRDPSPKTGSSTSQHSRGHRSPRPYARNGSRAPRKATRIPDYVLESSSDSSSDGYSDSDSDYSTRNARTTRGRPRSRSPRRSYPSPTSEYSYSERGPLPKAPIDTEPFIDHYAVLGLPRTATASEIKIAVFKILKVEHPDKIPGFESKSPEEQKRLTNRASSVNTAYEVLKDEELRARYDRALKERERASRTTGGRDGRRERGRR